jgi:hypothetical protein
MNEVFYRDFAGNIRPMDIDSDGAFFQPIEFTPETPIFNTNSEDELNNHYITLMDKIAKHQDQYFIYLCNYSDSPQHKEQLAKMFLVLISNLISETMPENIEEILT